MRRVSGVAPRIPEWMGLLLLESLLMKLSLFCFQVLLLCPGLL